MLKRKSSLKNEKGSAIIEVIPIIIVIVLFLNFSIGFFGAIHSGILNSIAARNYAFETFRHRSNLVYFRNTGPRETVQLDYDKLKVRVHAVNSEKSKGNLQFQATTRTIDAFTSMAKRAADNSGSSADHNNAVRDLKDAERNEKVGVNPIWIKSQYGICLNSACGV